MSNGSDISTPRWVFVPFICACLVVAMLAGLQWLDRRYPLNLDKLAQTSFVVEDRHGRLLRGFAAGDGRWRLPSKVRDVDPRFVKMLLAYEDKRFYSHMGVDVLALVRATGQMIWHRQIVSGGSTLTMQVARLLEEPKRRSLAVKLVQIGRALQLERRLSKNEILQAYLQLAPYGGNLEGIRAASLAYFGREPKVLNTAEAALLVAVPQSPESRRPDRHKTQALAARNRVLARLVGNGVINEADGERASQTAIGGGRRALPAFAAHLSDQARRHARAGTEKTGNWKTTLDRNMQESLEALVREKISTMSKKNSIAVLVADHQTGEILTQIASPDFFNRRRAGEVDMINAIRSPGSTLKPFIYGLAFEAGIVHPSSLIEDTPQNFSGYRPRNFDLGYQGTVSVEKALQLSLNIPAIKLLQSVGPDKLLARFRRADVHVKLPKEQNAGLAIGLGGLGVSLRDLVQLYSALPNGGKAVHLVDGVSDLKKDQTVDIQRSIGKISSWYLQDILSRVNAPKGAREDANIAYKTGTSYGYRDAWSVGFDGRYVIGVWVGRPDGVSVPGITGGSVAAPILFEVFGRLEGRRVTLAVAPPGVLVARQGQLPAVLKRFTPKNALVQHFTGAGKAPQIVYPPQDAKIDLGFKSGDGKMPLFIKMQGGKVPFRWLANGKPILEKELRRQVQWQPDSSGFSTLTVLDAVGRGASVRVFVE